MSGSDGQVNGGGAQQWSRPQHAVAYQEARAVLNAQQQRKSNLDDKALRTTRLTTVVVGALVTAVEAFGLSVVEPAGILGIGLLVVSFGAAIVVYSFQGPYLGPGESDLAELVAMSDEDWEQQFINQMGKWIDMNRDRLSRISVWLIAGDVALFAGVLATLYAIAI
ncbi:hypothetical protein [Halococcus sp. PRR34]|uniref:hypothetical protein n=1 Tax=Halococcus sp. PRR34 TaxID=3020830 RepID=UPI0023623A45|nr:hypothetical protein [Halococcus sp. PRR34]